MAPVCAACNQPISSARPGKARQRRMVALLSLPDAFATNQPAPARGAALASGNGMAAALGGGGQWL